MDVVIVESPAKAKTINKYLGKNFHVLASYGHVRDLPAKDGSVLPDDDFSMLWEIDTKSKKRLTEIANAVKNADKLILATDPDREGEAISWHVLEILKQKKVLKDKPIERVVFNAITKKSVLEAMQNPRQIDIPLVDAYLARRALDYLVGFTLSPVLWRKLPGSRSAGRVQSVALRLVCQREQEIEVFEPQEYWSIIARLNNDSSDDFEARVVGFEGEKITRLDIGSEARANTIKAALEGASFSISSIEAKPQKRNPYPPFTTSTLQQEASSKLGFAPARTMQVAQRLYEGINIDGETVGLITYMRTDGVDIAPEAIVDARKVIKSEYGGKYLPEKARVYKTKAKNAQEAHEAIRPTDLAKLPASVQSQMDPEQAKLYDLIWKRTIASQMNSAQIERTTVEIIAQNSDAVTQLRASGTVVTFDGFLTLYQSTKDDDDKKEDSKRLPALAANEQLSNKGVVATQHHTTPPARFSEASLIRKMEELGIGRPSTYAATMSVLQNRGYVRIEKRALIADDKGRIVTAFLESFFERYVEYDFTANLEEQLDQISAGNLAWKTVLHDFWNNFSNHVTEIKDLRVSEVLDALNEVLAAHIFPVNEDGTAGRVCPKCDDGQLSLKLGKFGSFIGCSNYPECSFTRQMSQTGDSDSIAAEGPKVLGIDPVSGLEVSLRSGRFGTYVQLGEQDPEDKKIKPKRGTIPKGWDAATLDFEKALSLINLPREIGMHPETSTPISAGIGRYGPFVLHDGTYANLPNVDDVFTIGLNHAVTLVAEKREKGGRRNAAQTLKELGEHPEEGGPVTVKDGRYGPYVNHGKINATLVSGTDPQSINLEQAVILIAEKAAKTPTKKKAAPKKKAATKKKTATKKTTAKKKTPARKKAAAKTAEPEE